jgi:predicted RNA-binding protein YlxR (DUF448 family)
MAQQLNVLMTSPQRTCIVCKQKGDQKSFLRIARDQEGILRVDGKTRRGRSAYVCHERKCKEEASKKGRVGRALKANPAPEELEKLQQEMEKRI